MAWLNAGCILAVLARSPASFGDNCNNCHGLHCSSWRRAEYFEERPASVVPAYRTSGRLILGWLFHSESSTTSRLHRHVSSAPQKHTRMPGSCASRRPPTTPTKPPLKQLVSHESWHIYPSICLSFRPSVRPSIYSSIHPSIYSFICWFVLLHRHTCTNKTRRRPPEINDRDREDTGVCARAWELAPR